MMLVTLAITQLISNIDSGIQHLGGVMVFYDLADHMLSSLPSAKINNHYLNYQS